MKWVKKFQLLVIWTLKKVNFTPIKVYFLKDVDINKELVFNEISCGEKNYKYFIGYLHNDDKVEPLHIMLPKTSPYLKDYDG